jgi:hypothetical protein
MNSECGDTISQDTVNTAETSVKAVDIKRHIRQAALTEPIRDKSNRLFYYCKYCTTKSYSTLSTTGLRSHVRTNHPEEVVSQVSTLTPDSALILRLSDMYDTARARNITTEIEQQVLKATIKRDIIKQALVNLIIARSLPLSIVEWPEFQIFCCTLNSQFNISSFTSQAQASILPIPSSHSTVKVWIEQSFKLQQDIVRKTLQSALTRIHISLDIWTTPNSYLTLGVCAHFVNIDGVRQTLVLGIRSVSGHAGDVQFQEALLPLFKDFGIERQIGVIVGDNSTTNDTLCRTISSKERVSKRSRMDSEAAENPLSRTYYQSCRTDLSLS